MLEEDLDRLDRHRRVGIDRHARNLPCLHEFLQQEEKLLGPLHRKGRHHDAAAALHRRVISCAISGQVVVRMIAVSVGGLHHQHVGRLALGRSGMHHLAGRALAVAHAADIAGEQADAAVPLAVSVISVIAAPRMCAERTKRKPTSGLSCTVLPNCYGRNCASDCLRLLQGVEEAGPGVSWSFCLLW